MVIRVKGYIKLISSAQGVCPRMKMNNPLAYIGGKSKLSKQIISLIPDHKIYCEVFSGAAWVFFRKEPSREEVINDLDSELIAFYRGCAESSGRISEAI